METYKKREMKSIGFANKYYTLWSVTSENKYTNVNGQSRISGVTISRTYFRNLAMNLADAKIKFIELTGEKNAPIPDDELKGKSRSYSETKEFNIYQDNEFNGGRCRGELIMECEDLENLLWFFHNCSSDRKELVIKRLASFDYYPYEDGMHTPSSIEKIKFNRSLIDGLHFENGEKVELNLTVRNMYSFNGKYGTTNVYEFYTEDKKLVKYMGSKGFGVDVGDELKVKATIKHSNYTEQGETLLLRIKLI